jgi:hypothetical protein
MSAVRTYKMSAILAATGKAGMESGPGQRFWNWRWIVLAIGYVLVFITGLQIAVAADPTGLILIAAAVGGVLFLHRTWFGVLVWVYVIASGVLAFVSGDDFGVYGVIGGLGFGAVALPIWSRRAVQPWSPAYWPQSPFVAPQPSPAAPVADPIVAAPLKPDQPAEKTPSAVPVAPRIRTIGRIEILTASGNLGRKLMRKHVIGFLWLYLLARDVRKPGDRLSRSAITDEVAYGVRDPRGRLRGYLLDLSRLPEPMNSMVKVDGEMIGFNLDGTPADFIELRDLAQLAREANGRLSDDLLRQAQDLLSEISDGDFLPGFEEMEKHVTKGRGVAGRVVAEARMQIDTLRCDLAAAVGEGLLDRGQASLAAALLEPIVRRSEDRDDLARILSTALRELGQHDRAAEVRRRYVLGQES